ncbi:MAG: sigma-70 family RNA polymerase sigma factor [Candidatus Delongbacteria bacterium]|nr:sigma-70 family RNA polymerase sigma factor [Candidatus Delongbacteria bacterium]
MSKSLQETFEIFFKENSNNIIKYVVKHIGNIEDARDLTQETFASCFKDLDRYDSEKSSMSTWIYVSLRNRMKNYYRDKKYNVPIEEVDIPQNADVKTEIEQSIDLEQMRNDISNGLKLLPVLQRKIIIMKYFKHFSTKEISKILNITPEYVRVLLSRALKNLKKNLDKSGYV